ncbi:MAG: hypothetical protein GWM90_10825, partial [Gemmatimonadetes bacterium]|nr:hypothetical protein [Gemmatimonadota bacterium]NIQ54447.1 hypothetical protein [Gemmatimonadota bacterium]NIU74655.1 hypothetical protein [Gammaproteobacteria bacterium]NIX44586.1 hypothetical protein [Gemmatimonadota bacterium]NIY08796.1 hypothetical protein [Gemmatimonadota bacterium]
LSTEEQLLGQAVREDVALFNNVLYRYAVAYAHDHPDLEPGFPVTEAVLSGFYTALVAEGVEIDRGVFDDASPLIERRLANEISVTAFNRQEGWKRLMRDDPQVRTALEILESARGTEDLFGVLPTYAQQKGLTLGSELELEPTTPHPF